MAIVWVVVNGDSRCCTVHTLPAGGDVCQRTVDQDQKQERPDLDTLWHPTDEVQKGRGRSLILLKSVNERAIEVFRLSGFL